MLLAVQNFAIYRPSMDLHHFRANENELKFMLHGHPNPYKRLGGRIIRFNPQRRKMIALMGALGFLFEFHKIPPVIFGRLELTFHLTFHITHQWEGDIDNYAKLIMDSLEKPFIYIGRLIRICR